MTIVMLLSLLLHPAAVRFDTFQSSHPAPTMLSLKDIHRHFGMRKTHEVLAGIAHRQVLSTGVLPIVEDLAYVGLVTRSADGACELTAEGAAALGELDTTCGHLLGHEPRPVAAI